MVLLGLREDDPDDIDAEDTQFSELTLPFTYLRTHTRLRLRAGPASFLKISANGDVG